MMDEKSWIQRLEREGLTDVRVRPMPPNADLPEHRHDESTVHVILTGELTITDASGTHTFRPGERVDIAAGTTHKARGSIDNGTMITGVKRA